jgi:hypothetical protein
VNDRVRRAQATLRERRLEALLVGTTADIWGNIPYSETVGDNPTPAFDDQMAVYTAVQALLDQAMNRSEVMQNLRYLSDVIGPRLSGSAAMRRANQWTASRFKAYGLTVALEPYPFGVTWERGTASLRLTAPFQRAITAHSWGWTEGTGGRTLSGPVVLVDVATPESLAVQASDSDLLDAQHAERTRHREDLTRILGPYPGGRLASV